MCICVCAHTVTACMHTTRSLAFMKWGTIQPHPHAQTRSECRRTCVRARVCVCNVYVYVCACVRARVCVCVRAFARGPHYGTLAHNNDLCAGCMQAQPRASMRTVCACMREPNSGGSGAPRHLAPGTPLPHCLGAHTYAHIPVACPHTDTHTVTPSPPRNARQPRESR